MQLTEKDIVTYFSDIFNVVERCYLKLKGLSWLHEDMSISNTLICGFVHIV